ncbi:glycosyltransferase [Candidatus Woesearchaeota archaeon]|nr:glycosyltransferase [Candidatus Woesearchaeota archaeon]
MVSLSLCMIVKDEEMFLEQCLNSVKGLVDEIIIVDTGSTDNTKEIASKFTKKIYDFEWCDDFSAARNESLKHAIGDWILVLDADETISKKDHQKINDAINSGAVAFQLIHRHYTNDSMVDGWISSISDSYKESNDALGFYSRPIVRLFKNDPHVLFEGCVHENVNESVRLVGTIQLLKIPIHHYGKLDLKKLKCKWELYESLGEKKLSDDHFTHYQLGVQYSSNNKINESIIAFKKSIELYPEHAKSWAMLGAMYKKSGEIGLALKTLKKAKKLSLGDFSVLVNLGSLQNEIGSYSEAFENLKLALKLNNKNPLLYINLGFCLYKLGDKKRSTMAFKRAALLDKKYDHLLRI